MKVGVDYYPEHWPRERWEKDASMMEEADLDVARLAEFSWSKMEPRKGDFKFKWLEDAIELLSDHDIEVILGTPTASPPAWIIHEDPDILPVDENGDTETFGGRRHYCPNNSHYRDHTKRIVKAMAERFKGNPNIIGWQIDNELQGRCYCEDCRERFHEWLKEKYESLENLNEEWGTVFWSQTYGDWDEIPVPLNTARAHNPSLKLDYFRFMSDSWVDYQQLQLDILHSDLDDDWITHNLMVGGYEGIDYSKLAQNLDFISWDNYPKYGGTVNPSSTAASHDLARGIDNTGYWIMEQQSGPTGWNEIATAPNPGQLRLWSYQALARGADSIVFFRWRTARVGTEQYWHGILDHHGEKGGRYGEIKEFSKEMSEFGERITPKGVRAEAGILKDYDTHWAFEIQPNSPSIDYKKEIEKYHKSLFDLNVTTDIITPNQDFSRYNLLIAPTLYLVDEVITERLTDFTEKGGTLILSYRSGVKNFRNNKVVNQRLPGKLSDLVGAQVEEYTSLPSPKDQESRAKLDYDPSIEFEIPEMNSRSADIGIWMESLDLQEAGSIAKFKNSPYSGKPAITVNERGDGKVIYIGTGLSYELHKELAKWITQETDISEVKDLPSGIEATWRGEEEILYLLNHRNEETEVDLDEKFRDVKSGDETERIKLPAYGVKILSPVD